MKDKITLVFALLGAAAFLFLVKQIYDMNGHMARMTEQVGGMRISVEAMSADVKAMRESVDHMSLIMVRGSQKIEQLNPMEMMEGFAPGGRVR
jgi:hypothetical protein